MHRLFKSDVVRIGLLFTLFLVNLFSFYALSHIGEACFSIVFFGVLFAAAAYVYLRKRQNFVELFVLLFLLCFFYWLYFHSTSQATYQFLDYKQGQYYRMLAGAFAKGSLGVVGGPPWDWCIYNNTNYLCHGPLPALVWAPFGVLGRLTSTAMLTFTELTLVCAITNLLVFYIMIRQLSRRFNVGNQMLWPRILFFLVYAFGPLYFLASRYFVYETSIIFGSTFMIVSFILFIEYLRPCRGASGKSSVLLLSSASLCLAFSSRTNLFLAFLPFTCLVFFSELTTDIAEDRMQSRTMQALFRTTLFMLPIVMSAALYLWYNAARFGNPLEFGLKYQYVGLPQDAQRLRDGTNFSMAYVPRNVYSVTLLAPSMSSEAPFVHYGKPEWLVGEYPKLTNIEYCSSIFFSSPLLLFAVFAIAYVRKSWMMSRSDRVVPAAIVLALISCAAFPFFGMGYSRRYLQDYYPFVVLLSYLGFLMFWGSWGRKSGSWQKAILGLSLMMGVAWTFAMAFDLNVQWAFSSDFSRALRIYNSEETFVPLS